MTGWFQPGAEEKTLDRNPFKISWAKLVVGDVVSLREFAYKDGDPVFASILILSNKKMKAEWLKIPQNIRREKRYSVFDYLYCVSIVREGKTCYNLDQLQNLDHED